MLSHVYTTYDNIGIVVMHELHVYDYVYADIMPYLALPLYTFMIKYTLMIHYLVPRIAVLAIAALTVGMLLSTFNLQVSGQLNGTSSKNTTGTTNQNYGANPINITGSIPLSSTITNALSSNVKTSLNEAVLTAQKAVGSNSSAILGFLRPLNGYLVYDLHVINNGNKTTYAVIVDPGNGKVLLKQALSSLSSAGNPFLFGRGGGEAGPFFAGHVGHGSGGGFTKNDGGAGCFHGSSSSSAGSDSHILNNGIGFRV
jgi:hypothetical protein